MRIRCYKCKRTADQFDYIKESAKSVGCDSNDFVQLYEPDYNPSTGMFLCQECYLEKLNDKSKTR